MSPVTHFLAGWLLASVRSPGPPVHGRPLLTRREKALVVAAAVAPDIDGFGLIPELLTRNSAHPLLWFSRYHHSLHNLGFALLCTAAAFLIAGLPNFAFGPAMRGRPIPTHPWLTAALVFLSFHLHLLCDLIGSRGPDGDQWPIPYLQPFSNALQLTWHGQWALNGWPNVAITVLLLLATVWLAWRLETSPLELFSGTANRAFARTLRQRFSPQA
jgi:inner membrane protein